MKPEATNRIYNRRELARLLDQHLSVDLDSLWETKFQLLQPGLDKFFYGYEVAWDVNPILRTTWSNTYLRIKHTMAAVGVPNKFQIWLRAYRLDERDQLVCTRIHPHRYLNRFTGVETAHYGRSIPMQAEFSITGERWVVIR